MPRELKPPNVGMTDVALPLVRTLLAFNPALFPKPENAPPVAVVDGVMEKPLKPLKAPPLSA